ncbi:zinc-binding dehydrogenase [Frigidibacter sp.]|uniref:quinone oxidoreductase family protein n=1 Tax=Frigidibacter sp. TaxID=2586418 RepID=UPI002732C782|nr:zinc-binding dehydrogenase [Frigidibacter sp.]MDP3339319.1 zinc-binding dehydrogenase [Frigidibacter sp.]
MMNAIRFHTNGGPEVLVYEQVNRPEPAPGEVLVKTRATGVNFADILRRKGGVYPVPSVMPYLLGGEAVGIIEALGTGVDPAMLGERVLVFPGQGSYAEWVAAPVDRVYPLPMGLPDSTALALFVQGLTASLILKRHLRIAKGESVLVQAAAGGVGLIAVQLARLYGAGTVIGCVSTPEKADLVRSLGADAAVNYTAEGWDEDVRNIMAGRGIDAVLDSAGGEVSRKSFGLLATFGRVAVFGQTGNERWSLDTQALCPPCASVSGFWLKPHLADRGTIVSEFHALAELVVQQRLRIKLGGVFRLSDAAAAHRALESRETSGKLVLVPDALADQAVTPTGGRNKV